MNCDTCRYFSKAGSTDYCAALSKTVNGSDGCSCWNPPKASTEETIAEAVRLYNEAKRPL